MITLDGLGGKPAAAPATAAAAGDLVKDGDITTFMKDVVQASMDVPVLVDFWAPWCGPCKQLGPAIEKAVLAAKGKLRLVKVNVDDPRNQPLAQQLRIQSIPAVFAFSKGQPVDGFVGALPDSQLKKFIEQVAGAGAAGGAAEFIEAGKAAIAEQDWASAGEAFSKALGEEPENAAALGGLARAMIGLGDQEAAEEILAQVPPAQAEQADVAAARAALQLAKQAASAAGDLGDFESRLAANPNDHQARYDFAIALLGAQRQADAMDQLLDIVKRDRKWNEEAARKQLVQMFEALGPMDPLVMDARRRLSSMLFS